MICFYAEEYTTPEGPAYVVTAVRRGKVNFGYAEVEKFRWAGAVGGVVRDVYVAFLDGGGEVYAVELGSRWWVGNVVGYVADFPYPPVKSGEIWTRFLTEVVDVRKPFRIDLLSLSPVYGLERYSDDVVDSMTLPEHFPHAVLDVLKSRYNACFYEWQSPGISKKQLGEEFRIKEVEGDYLRLVGRGKDEYLAWDFVLGTLEWGGWVLLGEDGLYVGVLKGERVVVEAPFVGSLYDVRGPPYAPFYPVVPVKWVRERLERAAELARRLGADRPPEVYTPPVDPEVLLKWPLRNVRWEFEIIPRLLPPNGGVVSWFECEDLCSGLGRRVPWLCDREGSGDLPERKTSDF